MSLSNSATLLYLALVVCMFCIPRPINAKPAHPEEPAKVALASQDYLDLQALLGKSLPGTPAEKTKVIDLLLQLLAEIDLPTLCNVINNDTSFSSMENDVMNNDMSVMPTTFEPTGPRAAFTNTPNEVDKPSGNDDSTDLKVTGNDTAITEKEEVETDDDSEQVSNSTSSPDSSPPEAETSSRDSPAGRPLKKIAVRPWRQRFRNSVNTDGTLPYPLRLRRRKGPVLKRRFIKNAQDLKKFGLPVPEKYSVPINLIKRRKIESLRASGKDGNFFIRSVGMRKPKAQLYSQSLVLGEWMDEHAPDQNSSRGNAKRFVEGAKENEMFDGKSEDAIVKDTKLGRRVMLVVRKGGKKRMPGRRVVYRRRKINSAAASRRGPIQYSVVKRIRSSLTKDSDKAGKKVVKKSFFLPRESLNLRLHRAKGDRFGAGGHRIVRNGGTKRRIFAGRPRVLRIRAGSRMRSKSQTPITGKTRFMKAVGGEIEKDKVKADETQGIDDDGFDHQTDAGVRDESHFVAAPEENVHTSPTQTSVDETILTTVLSTSPDLLSNENIENMIDDNDNFENMIDENDIIENMIDEDISLEEVHPTVESEETEIDEFQELDDNEDSSKFQNWDDSDDFERRAVEDEENMVDTFGEFQSDSQAPKSDKYSNIVDGIYEEQPVKTLYKEDVKPQTPGEELTEGEMTTININSLVTQEESTEKDVLSNNQHSQVNVKPEDNEADDRVVNVEIGKTSSRFEERTNGTPVLPSDSIASVDDVSQREETGVVEISDTLTNFDISNVTAILVDKEANDNVDNEDGLPEDEATTMTFVKENETSTGIFDEENEATPSTIADENEATATTIAEENEATASTFAEENEATASTSSEETKTPASTIVEHKVTASPDDAEERLIVGNDKMTDEKLQLYTDDENKRDDVTLSVGDDDVTEASQIALSSSTTQRSNEIQSIGKSEESDEFKTTETSAASVTRENVFAKVKMEIDPFMAPINENFSDDKKGEKAPQTSAQTTVLAADTFVEHTTRVDINEDNLAQSEIDVHDFPNKDDGLSKEQSSSEPKVSKEKIKLMTEVDDTETNLHEINSSTDDNMNDVETATSNKDVVSPADILTQEEEEMFFQKDGTSPEVQEITTERVFIKPVHIDLTSSTEGKKTAMNSPASISRHPLNNELPSPGDRHNSIATHLPSLTETPTALNVAVDSATMKTPGGNTATMRRNSVGASPTETPSDKPPSVENPGKATNERNPSIDVISTGVKRPDMPDVDELYASLVREPTGNNLTAETRMNVTTFSNESKYNQSGMGLQMPLGEKIVPNSLEHDSSNTKRPSDRTTVDRSFDGGQTTPNGEAKSTGQTLKSTTTENGDIEFPGSSIDEMGRALTPGTSGQTSSSPSSSSTTTTTTVMKTTMPESITPSSAGITNDEENNNSHFSESTTAHPVSTENGTPINEGTVTSTSEYDELTRAVTETDKLEQHLVTERSTSSESSSVPSEPEMTTPEQKGNRQRVAWRPEDISQNADAQLEKLPGFHYWTKPKVSTFQAKFSDWIGPDGRQNYVEPKSDKIDLWKAYNIALTNKYKSERKPKLQPESFPSSSKRNYLWNARTGVNSFENGKANSLSKQADGTSYDKVDPRGSKLSSFKPLSSLGGYRNQHVQSWGNRFSQGFYGRVYDERNPINQRFGFTNGKFTSNLEQNFIQPRTGDNDVVSHSKDQSQRVNSPQIIVEKPRESLGDFSDEEMRGLWYENEASVDKADLHNLFNKNSLKDSSLTANVASKVGHEEGRNGLPKEHDGQADRRVNHLNHLSRAAASEHVDLGPVGVPAPNDFVCPGMFGYHSDPEDCQAFFICSWGVPYRIPCPNGTLWNAKKSVCDWAAHVPCPHRDRYDVSNSGMEAGDY